MPRSVESAVSAFTLTPREAPAVLADASAAAERFGRRTVPTAEEEIWRYSRIDELDLDRFTPARRPTPTVTGPTTCVVDADDADCSSDDARPTCSPSSNDAF